MLIAKTMNLKHRATDQLECKDERGASTKAGAHRIDHGIVRATLLEREETCLGRQF